MHVWMSLFFVDLFTLDFLTLVPVHFLIIISLFSLVFFYYIFCF